MHISTSRSASAAKLCPANGENRCVLCVCWTRYFCPRRFGDAPMQCNLSLLVTLQAAFIYVFHAKASSWSICKSPAGNHKTRLQCAGHEPVCLVLGWTIACLYLPELFESELTHILRASYSTDIGINTASSCEKPTCFVSELVVGSSYQFDPGSASDPFTAHCLQYASTQPALISTPLYAFI